MKENVAEHLVSLLRRHGVQHVFGVPSGGWLPYMQAMQDGGVEFVLVTSEISAGFMATVYAWLKGVPGVCYGTVGPGSTNLSTGIGSALLDRSPVLAFTNEPPTKMDGRTTQMAIDQQALMRPMTKWTTRLNPSTVDTTISRAVQIATAEIPGPVHISLPGDLAGQEVPATEPLETRTLPMATPDTASMDRMQERFAQAKRPILAVGLTAVRYDLGDLVAQVAERHKIPVVLTPMAKGLLSEDHPSYAGVLFHALSDRVAETHKQADLVVGVGYDPVEFNYEEWMPSAELIHIDSVPADIDAVEYPSVTNVVGAIDEPVRRLAAMDPIASTWDLNEVEERKKAMFAQFEPKPGSFGPNAALAILREQLPDDGIMTCDVGSHTHLIGQAWRTPHRFGQIMTNGWSSMGFGVPSAIAAKLAQPEREVVCVTGDGGFMMVAGEMATARRLKLNVVFVVLTDGNLELIRIKQGRRGMKTYGTLLTDSELSTHQSIFGVPVLPATDADSYREALSKAFETDGPVIVEAVINPEEYDGLILRKHK